jgi:hypothetical protein
MTARRVVATMTCPRCAKLVPLCAIVSATACPSCGARVDVIEKIWDELTAEHDGGANVIASSDGVWQLEFHDAAEETRCPSCEAPFDCGEVIAEKGKACAKCRTPIRVREVPRDIARKLPPEARWIIAELEPHAHDERRREAITVHCQDVARRSTPTDASARSHARSARRTTSFRTTCGLASTRRP